MVVAIVTMVVVKYGNKMLEYKKNTKLTQHTLFSQQTCEQIPELTGCCPYIIEPLAGRGPE